MLFNSLQFVCFALIVFPLYYVLTLRWQNILLLAASVYFYAAWDWRFLALLVFTTVLDYYFGKIIDASQSETSRRRLVITSVVLNLGVLGIFKYYNFFAGQLARLLQSAFGLNPDPFLFHVALPIGISFYTFQSMSYTIDIYRRELKPAKTLFDFALYIAFFPQLVAGPIERAGHLLPQLMQSRQISWSHLQSGGWLLFWGFYKKLFVADNLAVVVQELHQGLGTGSGPASMFQVLLLSYAISVQVYCDFGGYSDIARGLARLMGIDLMINFNFPFFSQNPREFWQRWHISLSRWLRDYLYIPLGGNKFGSATTSRNLMLTMLLGGLWHGAAWHFVLWGAYHGVLLVLHRGLERLDLPWLRTPSAAAPARALTVFKAVCMFQLTAIGFLIFRCESMTQLWTLLSRAATPVGDTAQWNDLGWQLLSYTAVLWIVDWLMFKANDHTVVHRWRTCARVMLYLILFYSIVWFGELGGLTFVYFQF